EALIKLEPSFTVRSAAQKIQLDAATDTTRFSDARGRISFETYAGATIIGADVKAVLPAGQHEFLFEDSAWHVREPPGPPQVVLVEVKRAEWPTSRYLAVAIYPGLVATAVVDADGCWSMNYLPSLNTTPNGVAPPESLEAFQAVAETTASL